MHKLSIDPFKTALVVIDLQKGIVNYQTAPYSSDMVVKNAAALANKFRQKMMPIFLVRVKTSDDGKDRLQPITDQEMSNQTLAPDWSEIVSEMGQSPNDLVITKHQWGAFYGTDLDLQSNHEEK